MLLEPQNDPISFMEFLNTAHRAVGVMEFPETMSWQEAIAIINEWMGKLIPFDCYYRTHLGDETKLTNKSAEFIILTENEDDRMVAEGFMFNFKIQYPRR